MGVNLLAECNGFRTLGKHLECHMAASNGKIRKKVYSSQQLLILSWFAFSLTHWVARICVLINHFSKLTYPSVKSLASGQSEQYLCSDSAKLLSISPT